MIFNPIVFFSFNIEIFNVLYALFLKFYSPYTEVHTLSPFNWPKHEFQIILRMMRFVSLSLQFITLESLRLSSLIDHYTVVVWNDLNKVMVTKMANPDSELLSFSSSQNALQEKNVSLGNYRKNLSLSFCARVWQE